MEAFHHPRQPVYLVGQEQQDRSQYLGGVVG